MKRYPFLLAAPFIFLAVAYIFADNLICKFALNMAERNNSLYSKCVVETDNDFSCDRYLANSLWWNEGVIAYLKYRRPEMFQERNLHMIIPVEFKSTPEEREA